MSFSDKDVVDSWIALQSVDIGKFESDPNFWALEELDRICDDDPCRCLNIIKIACDSTEDELMLSNIAAGPLEDLIARHGVALIEEVEANAKNNPKLKRVLAMIWKNSIDDVVWDRIQSLVGKSSRN